MASGAGGERVADARRRVPNILVTGTPGTGKTTLSEAIAERLGFHVVNVGDRVREGGFHAGRDEEFDTLILDDESVDAVREIRVEMVMESMGGVVECQSATEVR
jgi:adenylate kinase